MNDQDLRDRLNDTVKLLESTAKNRYFNSIKFVQKQLQFLAETIHRRSKEEEIERIRTIRANRRHIRGTQGS